MATRAAEWVRPVTLALSIAAVVLPAAAQPPTVRVTSDSQRLTIRVAKARRSVFIATPDQPVKFEVEGPGKLRVELRRVLGPAKSNAKPVWVRVITDGQGRALDVRGTPDPQVRVARKHGIRLSAASSKTRKLGTGPHVIEVIVPRGRVAVFIAFRVAGDPKPIPVVAAPAAAGGDALALAAAPPEADGGAALAKTSASVAGSVEAGGADSQGAAVDASTPTVRVTSNSKRLSIRVNKARRGVFVATADQPLTLEFEGPGKLQLELRRVMGRKQKKVRPARVQVVLDGKVARVKVGGPTDPTVRVPPKHGIALSTGFKTTRKVAAGRHTVEVVAPPGPRGVAVFVAFRVPGKAKPIPVIAAPPPAGGDALALTPLETLPVEAEGGAPPAETAPPEPGKDASQPSIPTVRVTSHSERLSIRVGKARRSVFVATAEQPLKLEIEGPGRLKLELRRVMGRKQKKVKRARVQVIVDGKAARVKVGGPTDAAARVPPKHGIGLSAGTSTTRKLAAGPHTVEVVALPGARGVAVFVVFRMPGHAKPIPVIVAPAAAGGDALALTPLQTPLIDAKDEVPPIQTPEVASGEAVMPEAPKAEPEPPPAPTVKERIAAGEIRHGLESQHDELTLVHENGERRESHLATNDRPFVILVDGPCEITIRMHRLIDSAEGKAAQGTEYSIVLLEDDVVLQQVRGKTEVSSVWKIDPASGLGWLTVAKPKEVRLQVATKVARLAFLVSDSVRGGMAMSYEFTGAEKSLASSMLLSLDDDEDGIGLNLPPTIVTEVDIKETVIERIVYRGKKEFLGLGLRAGAVVPPWGGQPSLAAALEITFALPFAGQAFALGLEGGFQRHDLSAAAPDELGGVVSTRATVNSVPILGLVSGRLRLSQSFRGYVTVGGGIMVVLASVEVGTTSQEDSQVRPLVRAGGGIETLLGPGWLGFEVTWTQTFGQDLQILENYSPGGLTPWLRYRFGF